MKLENAITKLQILSMFKIIGKYTWLSGTIRKRLSHVLYEIEVESRVWCRHANQLRSFRNSSFSVDIFEMGTLNTGNLVPINSSVLCSENFLMKMLEKIPSLLKNN